MYLDSKQREATRLVDYSGITAKQREVDEAVLPAAYVVPRDGSSYWLTSDFLGPMTAMVPSDILEDVEILAGNGPAPKLDLKNHTKPVLSADPFLLEVIAGSSAAGGLLAVESITTEIIEDAVYAGLIKREAGTCAVTNHSIAPRCAP